MDQSWMVFAIILLLSFGVVMVRRVPGPPGIQGPPGRTGPPVDTEELLKVMVSNFPDHARKVLPEFLPSLIPPAIPGPAGPDGRPPSSAEVEAAVRRVLPLFIPAPLPGPSPTMEQVEAAMRKMLPGLIPAPIPGPPGPKGESLKGEAGPPPTKEQIDDALARLLPSLIPEPIPGPPGVRGPIGLPAPSDGTREPAVISAESGKTVRQAGRWSNRVRVEPWIFQSPEMPVDARVGDLWVDLETAACRPILMICTSVSPIEWVEV